VKVAPFGLSTDEIKRELSPLRHDFSIAVVRAKNPFNIGAIIRVAHSFLVREILLIGNERYYERAAMGMSRYENIVELPDEEAFLERARREGWKLTVFEKEVATADLWRAPLPEECVMVFGSEAEGVPPSIVAAADQVIAIPMYGINHSFPVTVAAGIAMAEWTRRHYAAG